MSAKPKETVKNGYVYREKQGGGKVLRIRKVGEKAKPAPKPFTPERVAKFVKNPGDRSKVPTRLLPDKYRKTRELNQRLEQPVTPGSSITRRELGQQTKSYITQKYGAGDLAAQQGIAEQGTLSRDSNDWYGQYLKDLQQHSENVGRIADATVQQTRSTGNMIQQAGQQATSHMGDPATQALNANAAATRDKYVSGQVGLAANTGAANKTYASTLAKVVGPGQKLQSQVQNSRQLVKLKEAARQREDTKGADATTYRAGVVANEEKNQLATAIAQGKSAIDKYKAETGRINALKPSGKSPPVPYYTWSQWKSLSSEQKRSAVADYKAMGRAPKSPPKPKTVKPTKLPKGSADQIKSFKQAVQGAAKFKRQNPKYGSDAAARWLQRKATGNSPLLEQAAAEAGVDGFIHKTTAERIRKQLGIRVRDLGYPVR